MKPVDVRSYAYIKFDTKNNDKGFKFRVLNHVTISKFKNTFAKGNFRH